MANSENLSASTKALDEAFDFLTKTVNILNDVFKTTTNLITTYSGQAAELVDLAGQTELNLAFLQKLKHAAAGLRLDFPTELRYV